MFKRASGSMLDLKLGALTQVPEAFLLLLVRSSGGTQHKPLLGPPPPASVARFISTPEGRGLRPHIPQLTP